MELFRVAMTYCAKGETCDGHGVSRLLPDHESERLTSRCLPDQVDC
jgi:hypothetical protein